MNHYILAFEAQNNNNINNKNKDNSENYNKNCMKENINSKATLAEIFQDQNVRLLLVSSIVLQMSQQLCVINAVFYYSTMFFDGVIENPLVVRTLVMAVNAVATYLALLLMDS